MSIVISAESFVNSPAGSVVIGVTLTALVTVAFSAIRLMVSVSNMGKDIVNIRSDIEDIKNSRDIMRYSDMREIGRMQAQPRQQRGRRD